MRILVTGSRDWDDRDCIVEAIVTALFDWDHIGYGATIVHGGAPGADRLRTLPETALRHRRSRTRRTRPATDLRRRHNQRRRLPRTMRLVAPDEPRADGGGGVTTQPALVGLTERNMLDMLRMRYRGVYGNGGFRYAYAEHVRSHAGFDARRTADFVAMDLWPSKGLALHGHEVKVSRSDWLTELKKPEKAAEFMPYMDYWWLVAADKTIVRDDLPDGWGLMVAAPGALRVVKPAPRNMRPEPMPKTMLASLLRSVTKTAQSGLRALKWGDAYREWGGGS